jgi:putative flippase GtrA
VSAIAARTARALRRPHNWIQLAKFVVVGVSGYAINLLVFAGLVGWGAHVAATISFVVAASNNYLWNRLWTFRHAKSNVGIQGARFFVVSLAAFGVNQLWLVLFIDVLDWRKVLSQAIAIVLVTPLNFIGNKLWSFRRCRRRASPPGRWPSSPRLPSSPPRTRRRAPPARPPTRSHPRAPPPSPPRRGSPTRR